MSSTYAIQLTPAFGVDEAFSVEGARIRIGSAAYCEVRLNGAAAEQVILEDRGLSGMYAEAVSASPVATINGAPFTSQPLLPEDVLEVAGNKLRVSLVVAAAASAMAGVESSKKTKPWVYLAAIVGIPFCLTQISFDNADETLTSESKPPALFTSARPACPQADPESARALAAQQVDVGDTKRERRPFRAHDGVQGVGFYETAAACYLAAGDGPASDAARKDASALRVDLEESYRTHRVRLEHALTIKNYVVARREVHALRDLTQGQTGGYVSWLSNLDRRLKLLEKAPQ